MALADKDIFNAICEQNPGKPIEYIMKQYEIALRMNREIEKNSDRENDANEIVQEQKKYTRRGLKIKPRNSILEDVVYCCICGEPRQAITSRHLATHGITVEDYKKLCGFAPSQSLMSEKRLKKSREATAMARNARHEAAMARKSMPETADNQ